MLPPSFFVAPRVCEQVRAVLGVPEVSGCSPHDVDGNGETALHHVVFSPNPLLMTRALLAAGCLAGAVNLEGYVCAIGICFYCSIWLMSVAPGTSLGLLLCHLVPLLSPPT